MKRSTTVSPVYSGGNEDVDPWRDQPSELAQRQHEVEFDADEEEAVFHHSAGSIFSDTSLIEDALLREAIGGRFR